MIQINLTPDQHQDVMDALAIADSVLNKGATLFNKHEKLQKRDRFKKLLDELDYTKDAEIKKKDY